MNSNKSIIEHPVIDLDYCPLEPRLLIVGYSDEDGNNPFFEFKSVVNGEVGQGKPLYKETLQDLLKLVKPEEEDTSWFVDGKLPRNVLHLNTKMKTITWVVKSQKHYLHFSDKSKIPSGEYHLPHLVFHLNRSLKIYTVKSLAPNANLYYAPLYNIYQDGRLCMGNVRVKPTSYNIIDIMKANEQAFFGSQFTHTNHKKIFYGGDKAYKEYMKGIVNTPDLFDASLLVKIKNGKLKNLL